MLATTMAKILMGFAFRESRDRWYRLVIPACYRMVFNLYKNGPIVDIPLTLKKACPSMYHFLTCNAAPKNHNLKQRLSHLDDKDLRQALLGYNTNIPQVCFLTCFIWLTAEMYIRQQEDGDGEPDKVAEKALTPEQTLNQNRWRFMRFPVEEYHCLVERSKDGPTLDSSVYELYLKTNPEDDLSQLFAPRFQFSLEGKTKRNLPKAKSYAAKSALFRINGRTRNWTENVDSQTVEKFFTSLTKHVKPMSRIAWLETQLEKFDLQKAYEDATEKGSHFFTSIYLKKSSTKGMTKMMANMSRDLAKKFSKENPDGGADIAGKKTKTAKPNKEAKKTADEGEEEDKDTNDGEGKSKEAAEEAAAKPKQNPPRLGVPQAFLLTGPDKNLYNKVKDKTKNAKLSPYQKAAAPALALAQIYAEKSAYLLSVAHQKAMGGERKDLDTADGIGKAMAKMGYIKGGRPILYGAAAQGVKAMSTHIYGIFTACQEGGDQFMEEAVKHCNTGESGEAEYLRVIQEGPTKEKDDVVHSKQHVRAFRILGSTAEAIPTAHLDPDGFTVQVPTEETQREFGYPFNVNTERGLWDTEEAITDEKDEEFINLPTAGV